MQYRNNKPTDRKQLFRNVEEALNRRNLTKHIISPVTYRSVFCERCRTAANVSSPSEISSDEGGTRS